MNRLLEMPVKLFMRAFVQVLKKLVIISAILVTLGYVGNLFLDNPYIHRILRDGINRQLDDYTKLSLKFEAINAKFLPLGIDIYGIQVRRKTEDNKTESPLLQSAHIQVRFSIWALMLSKSEIFDIEIHEPKFALPLPPLEELLIIEKFPALTRDQGPILWPLDFTLPLYRLSWFNATIDVQIPGEKPQDPELLKGRLAGFDLQLTFRNAQDSDLYLHSRRTNLKVEGRHLLQDLDLEADLHLDRDKLSSRLFRIKSNELNTESSLELTFETEAEQSRPGLFNTKSQILKGLFVKLSNRISQADIAILGRYLRASDTGGPLNGEADLQMHIPLDERAVSWRVDGRGQSANAKLSGFKLLESTLDFSIDEKGMTFEKARVLKNGVGLAKGHGFIGFSTPVPIEFDIVPENLSLTELLDVLQVPDFQAVQTELESNKIELRGSADPFELRIGGLVRYKGLTMPFIRELPQRFMNGPNCLLQTQITANEKALTINQATGECRSADDQENDIPSPLQMAGRFFFSTAEGLDITLNSAELRLPLLNHFTKIPATGLGHADVRIKGPYDALVLEGEARAKDVNFGGFKSAQLEAAFRYPLSGDRVYLPKVQLRPGGPAKVRLNDASIAVRRPFSFKADIDVEQLPSAFIGDGLAQSFDLKDVSLGIRSAQGQLAGDLLKPFTYTGKLQYMIQDLVVSGQRLLSESSGTFLGSRKVWRLHDSYLKLDQIEARFGFEAEHKTSRSPPRHIWHRLGLGTEDHVQIQLKTINQNRLQYRTNDVQGTVNHLASLPYVGSFFRTHDFGGEIVVETQLEGSIDKLQGKIDAALESPFVWGIPISSFYLSGFIDGGRLRIPELRHSGSGFVGRLNIDFDRPELPYDWYFYFNQLDVRALIGKFFADDPRNFAYLSAEWTMKGSLRDFWASSGDFTLSRIRSKIFRNLGGGANSVELNSDDPIRVTISPERWRFTDKRPLKLKGEYFNLELTAGDNRLPDHLDLNLQGSVKLDILKNFSSLAETARGEVLIEGYLRGSIDKPEISVRFKERKLDPFNLQDWTPLTIGIVDLGPALTNVSFDIEWRYQQLLVHKFRASKGREGDIEVTGILNFAEQADTPSRLAIKLDRIEFNRLNIPVLKSADLVLSGDLIVTGTSLPFNLTGNIQVDRFLSIGNFDLRKEIVSSLYDTRLSASVSGTTLPERNPYVNLDVGVQADKSIVLKNKSLEATLSSNLRVRGTDLQPLLLGQILADRGSFNYRRQFRITQAVISFDEPVSPPNPRLDIIGSATINPYQVQVQVTGDLATPRVTLTCDPPNREDGTPISNLDIVLLITTGKIPEQANKTAERASVNEIFSSFLVFAEEPIEKLFDLSGQTVIREVYIDSYLSEVEERPVTRLNVPFNLWGMANAVVQVDDESNAKLSFEYPIHESITFSGSVDRSAKGQSNAQSDLPKDSGFDLKFRFGFD
jgi:hypothetical protein